MAPSPRTRDAARSREALLAAAERLFAERGFDGVSLAEVGAAAGLSRATPGYFFGSKEALYAAVLQRAFAERDEALRPVFAPLGAWARAAPGAQERPLADVLLDAARGYVTFLARRPAFVALVQRESVDGGRRLAATPHASTVLVDTLRALRRSAPRHGLAAFDVREVVVAFVALCFTPLAHRDTLLRTLGLDAADPDVLDARARQAAEVVLVLVGGGAVRNLSIDKLGPQRRSTSTSGRPMRGWPPSASTRCSTASP